MDLAAAPLCRRTRRRAGRLGAGSLVATDAAPDGYVHDAHPLASVVRSDLKVSVSYGYPEGVRVWP